MNEDAINPGNNSSALTASSPPPAASALNFSNVLHFLHGEWRRFESDRNQWELERSDLNSKLSFLEGERRGFEVLKTDLLRRIKMLEYALRQERAKYLVAPVASAVAVDSENPLVSTAPDQPPPLKPVVFNPLKSNNAAASRSMTFGTARGGGTRTRDMLKQYLKEVGYSEKDDLQGSSTEESTGSGDWQGRKFQTMGGISNASPSRRPLSSIFPTKAAETPIPSSFPAEQPKIIDDADEVPPAAPPTLDKKARRKQVTESVIYAPSEHADGKDAIFGNESNDAWGTVFSSKKAKDESLLDRPNKDKKAPVVSQSTSLDSELADLSLGDELADTEEKSTKSSDTKKTSESKLWHSKFTLKNHLDGVRSMSFHPAELALLTTSEDGTAKYWNLENMANLKKVPADIEPIYTFRGHRGSVNASVISLMIPPSLDSVDHERMENGVAFTGGLDSVVRLWALPPKNLQPNPKYEFKKVSIASLVGHTDAIWDLKLHPIRPLLASLSADGSVKLWDLNAIDDSFLATGENSPLKASLYFDGFSQPSNIIPTSMDFVHTDLKQILISYQNSQLKLFDIETGKPIASMQKADSTYNGTTSTQINKVVAHGTLPLAITAHEDRYIRFFDVRARTCTHSMIAHLDSVSSLDVSPNGLILVSGGHDGSTRVWDINSHACLQEFTYHRKKFDEAIHCVQFHPRTVVNSANVTGGSSNVSGGSAWLATAGADSCSKIYSYS